MDCGLRCASESACDSTCVIVTAITKARTAMIVKGHELRIGESGLPFTVILLQRVATRVAFNCLVENLALIQLPLPLPCLNLLISEPLAC
jgi:hypothetical protein